MILYPPIGLGERTVVLEVVLQLVDSKTLLTQVNSMTIFNI